MALADPQTVTIATVATQLHNVGTDMGASAYQNDAGEVVLTIRHTSTKRTRHQARLQKSLITADPLVPSINTNVSWGTQLTIDTPKNGVTTAMAADIANALVLWATPANIAKLCGGQS